MENFISLKQHDNLTFLVENTYPFMLANPELTDMEGYNNRQTGQACVCGRYSLQRYQANWVDENLSISEEFGEEFNASDAWGDGTENVTMAKRHAIAKDILANATVFFKQFKTVARRLPKRQ